MLMHLMTHQSIQAPADSGGWRSGPHRWMCDAYNCI